MKITTSFVMVVSMALGVIGNSVQASTLGALSPSLLGIAGQVQERADKNNQKAAERREDWRKHLDAQASALRQFRRKIEPSAVNISVGQGRGAGFIVDAEKGLIMTAAHVVQGQKDIGIDSKFMDDAKAQVVAIAPERDIAIIQIPGGIKLKNVEKGYKLPGFGDTTKMERFDPVVSLGNPAGLGVIHHDGKIQRCEFDEYNPYAKCMITSAKISGGDSGGPLFNHKGEIIGMNHAMPSGTRDISIHVRGDELQAAMKEYTRNGDLIDLGLGGSYVLHMHFDGPQTNPFQLPPLRADLMVGTPQPGTGLQARDLVISIDGNEVGENQVQVMRGVLAKKKQGDKVTLRIKRWVDSGQQDADGNALMEEKEFDVEVPVQKLDERFSPGRTRPHPASRPQHVVPSNM